MSKRDDVDLLYKRSNMLAAVCKYLFWGNCILSIVAAICSGQMKVVLTYLQIIGAIIYVVIKGVDDGLFWYSAEMARRKNSIQVAFDVPLSELETVGYYNNTFAPSIEKYALNAFESNYFSKFIAGKMLVKSALMALISVVALLVTGWLVASGDILLIISQAVFSAYVVEDTILLTIYKLKMDNLYEEAFSSFVTVGIKNEKQKVWLLSYAIEYEAIKAHYKVRLDSAIFNKYNDELSKKWDLIQQKVVLQR